MTGRAEPGAVATVAVAPLRAIWLLTALRMRRVGNMLSAAYNRRRSTPRLRYGKRRRANGVTAGL